MNSKIAMTVATKLVELYAAAEDTHQLEMSDLDDLHEMAKAACEGPQPREDSAFLACEALVDFANHNNRINLNGKLGEAVTHARAFCDQRTSDRGYCYIAFPNHTTLRLPAPPTLNQAIDIIGGYVERLVGTEGDIILVHEEAKVRNDADRRPNELATHCWTGQSDLPNKLVGVAIIIGRDIAAGSGW